jgi:hypothetical protein
VRLSAEHLYEVPPLSLPDLTKPLDPAILHGWEAVRLFVERAKAVRPSFELDDDSARTTAEICARVDGLLLALELAAARMSVLSPAALLARLDSRLATLSVGARDRPARQQTLRATLDWSYDLLDSSEQTLLNRLSVFAGGCRIVAAEAICDPDADLEIDIFEGLSPGRPSFIAFLTMEVQRWYWRTRPGARGHVSPAKRPFKECLRCPRVPACAQPDVPVSYPRCVVCLSNRNQVNILGQLFPCGTTYRR